MRLPNVLLIFLLSLMVIVCALDAKEDEETLSRVEDDWIDPHNMLDDRGGGGLDFKGLLDLLDGREKDSEAALRSAFSNIQDELQRCKKKLEDTCMSSSSSKQGTTTEKSSCDTPYFKQLIRVIYEATTELRPLAEINLSAEERRTLKKLLNDEANIHDVHAILLSSVTNGTISESFVEKSMVFFSAFLNAETLVLVIYLTVLIITLVVFEVRTTLTLWQQFFCLLVLLFVVSIPWEWYRLYKKEFAKKQGIMMETLQKHCKTDHELGPMESLNLWWKSSFSTVDSSCAKYQEALLVDAVWEVAPSMAVSVTITRFFVQPLEHIADAVGKSFRALFQHVPLQWQPFMFLACLVFAFALPICVRGFHISSPLLRFGVGGQPALGNAQLLRIENQLQQMQAEQNVVPAIENVPNEDQAIIQAVLDIARAINERSQQQDALLKDIQNKVQDIRRHCRREEAVEHPEQNWEVVGPPIPVSDLHPTENGPTE